MGILFTHQGEHVTTVRPASVRLQEVAEMGRVGQGSVTIEDSAGTQSIIGHKAFRVTESDCSQPRTARGFVADHRYRRDILRTAAARIIEVDVVDLNAKLAFKVIRGNAWRKRPKETIGERLTDLLASGFLNVEDNGFVQYPDIDLDGGEDLRGQHPGDVLTDMATRAGFNFFVYWDESADETSLWFQDSNTSTDWESTLRISNVLADLDTADAASFLTGTTFAASEDTELRRSPAQTVSGVWVPYKRRAVYRTREATEEIYEPRDGTAPNSNIKTVAKARNIGDRFLFHHRNEEDRITTTIQVPSSKVNLVRAGQRIEAKFSHLATEGYGDFTWFRVLERTVTLPAGDDDIYNIAMVLSPQEGAATGECTPVGEAALIQYKLANHASELFLDFDVTPAVGNLMLLAVGHRDEIGVGPLPTFIAGWTQVPQDNGVHYVYADSSGGGLGHASLWYRVVQPGDTGVYVGSDCMKILAEFTPVCSEAIDAAKDDSSGNLGASISQTSGAPGVPALVAGAYTTRQTDTGTFSAGAGTNRVPPTGDYPIAAGVGHDRLILLWSTSTDGTAVTFTGVQAGGTVGDYYWGGRIAAFEMGA